MMHSIIPRNVLFSYRVSKLFFDIQRLKFTESKLNIAAEMKKLNDQHRFHEALRLFDEQQSKQPDDLSINQALKACSKQRDFKRGLAIEKRIPVSSLENHYVRSSLINFYMETGHIDEAQRIFVQSQEKTQSMFAIMMKGFVKNNMAEKAIEFYKTIPIKPNDIILIALFNGCSRIGTKKVLEIGRKAFEQTGRKYWWNTYFLTSALDMFIKCGDVSTAERIFPHLPEKTIIKYGAMMKGFNQNDEPLKTFALFEEMKKNSIVPNQIIFTLLIDACSQIGMLSRSQSVDEQIPPELRKHLSIQNGLIDMWGKSGCVTSAEKVFRDVDHPDTITFTAMIHSYGINGFGREAVDLFSQMPKNVSNEYTVLAVLNACAHAGLVDQARTIFTKTPIKTTKIYTSMVDCLSRLFLFDEAQKLIDEYEKNHPVDEVMNMTILSGARNQRNTALGENIFEKLKKNFPERQHRMVAASILLANTYSSTKDYERSLDIQEHWRNLFQTRREIGTSWTEVNGEISRFTAHDQTHPRSNEIFQEIDRLSQELMANGHRFDSSWITRPLSKDETIESALSSHSERLALAFNLIQPSIPNPIQITKNLRVCGDCHAAIKLIARIRKLQIIIRDKNRFHHFDSDGNCSCRDHF